MRAIIFFLYVCYQNIQRLKSLTEKHISDILQQISENSLPAFSAFYTMYFQKLYDFSKYYFQSNETCKEIVSDVFFNIWQNRKNLVSIRNIDNYLFIAIKNQSIKYKKNNGRNEIISLEVFPSDFFVEVENPEHTLIVDEVRLIIQKAIDDLPEKCRIIFLMVREEGLKYKEAAEILSISERTVHAQMVIAVKKIIRSIQQYFPSFNEGKSFTLFVIVFKNPQKL